MVIQMRRLRDCYDSLVDGERLTDEECKALRAQFLKAAEGCGLLGPRFELATKEAYDRYYFLNQICDARGIG